MAFAQFGKLLLGLGLSAYGERESSPEEVCVAHLDEGVPGGDPAIDLAVLSVDGLVDAALAMPDADEDWAIVGELQRRGDEETLAAALRLTRSLSVRERVLGAWVLTQIGYRYPDIQPFASVRASAVVRLLELLESDRDGDVVRAAISGLGSQNATAALDRVLALASNEDPETRLAVAMAFPGLTGRQRDLAHLDAAEAERVVSTLVALGDDEDDDVRNWALFALARQYDLDTSELRETFVRHLDDHEEEARAEAMVGLARRGDTRALPALLDALHPDTATETVIEAAACAADDRLLASLEELVRSGWDNSSTLDGAIRNCDPQQRAYWEAVGATLAATLRLELEAGPFVVEVGREPLEWFPRLAASWKLADGSEPALYYDLVALVETRLAGDLEEAPSAFREDIAKAERQAATEQPGSDAGQA